MGAAFAVTPLASGGYLVEGEDVLGAKGSTRLASESWEAVLYLRRSTVAVEDFDAKVEAFFKPLTDAAEKLRDTERDPAGSVTIGEEVEGKESTTVELDESGVILNLLDQGDFDRLRWVGGDLVAVKA